LDNMTCQEKAISTSDRVSVASSTMSQTDLEAAAHPP